MNLEKKFAKKQSNKQNVLRLVLDWVLSRGAQQLQKKKQQQSTSTSPFDSIPNEVLYEILNFVNDHSSILSCRAVNRRFHALVDRGYHSDKMPLQLSRLIISGLPRGRGAEMRWIAYETQQTKTISIAQAAIRKPQNFQFNFKRFVIHRLILKDINLTDDFICFLRLQLSSADLSQLSQLTLSKVDFLNANSLTLHCLLAVVGKNLENFEVHDCYNMRPDSITDAHLIQLNAARIRRISIDGVKLCRMGNSLRLDKLFTVSYFNFLYFRIGDESLQHFASLKSFPAILLDRCIVTTNTVCDYTQEWFDSVDEGEKRLRSQVVTVKRCVHVKGSAFEAECRKRGLSCRNRRGSGSLTLYNVHEENTHRVFTVALAAALMQENQENDEKPVEILTNKETIPTK
ncbi:hypothetical protein WR25_19362 isoform D [Diploscapter pachys]|uniref:F-box domain-containing protein n=1 Tax=Diploscapter pachys TaxID=2018661 RepID=A0A2A2L6S5_9BILA|nr:hypothetical protein WR25_19362 isoform D [Diploscapter pachys]